MFASLTRLIRLTLLVVILIAVILFTVSNRGDIMLSLFPLPYEVALPTYLFFLLTLLLGYVAGGLSNGLKTLHHKRAAKREHRKVEALEQEVASLRAKEATLTAPKSPITNAPKLTTS